MVINWGTNNHSMDDHRPLPEDLLVDILLRLPVKSLLLFKCVSKRWYALIKSPSFIEKHFHHRNNRARLLICNLKLSFERNVALQSVDFSLLPNKIVPGVTAEPKPLYQLEKVTGFTCFVGPVDGLFLVQKDLYRDNVRLALWNPATREFWPLPPAPFEIENFLTDHDHQFGLGFDQVSKDYKVVWIRVFWDELGQGVYPRIYASVYSLCNNTWKNLSPEFQSSCTLSASLNATYLNGFYYWLSRGLDEIYNVRSFDIGNEQFGEIRGPDIPSEQCGTLLLHGESLAMLAGYPGTSVYDLWVMIQEGNWTKVLTVQPLINANWPRGIWENDKMIFDITETSQLVLYDNTTKDVTELGYQQDPSFERCWVFNYKESLVPIKRENDTWDQDNVVELIDHFFPTL